jgi:mannose-6-phosphate isomerase-like protein (cupin superfamily)
MNDPASLFRAAAAVALFFSCVAVCAHDAAAQTGAQAGASSRREPPPATHDYLVLTGGRAEEIERRLRPDGREDLVGASGGLQTLMYVQSERDREHEGEIHEAADDYHIVLEGSAVYTLGGRLEEPKETRPGEWRAGRVAGGKTYEVKKGDIVFVPRGVVHQRDTRGRSYSMMLIKVYAEARPVTAGARPAAGQTRRQDAPQRPGGATAAKLVGTWRLVDSDEVRAGGEVVRARGERPRGILVYGADGRMSVQVMSDNRPKFKAASAAEGTPDEIGAAFAGYTAYFGKFEVDERERAVLHHMEGSLFPNEVGATRKRFYEFAAGDRLILTALVEAGGERRTRRIVWERVR